MEQVLLSGPIMNAALRLLRFVAVLVALAPLARAHPGHDGHELTWDFGHLAAHPIATVFCVAVLLAGTWGLSRKPGGWMARRQSFLKSADIPRK